MSRFFGAEKASEPQVPVRRVDDIPSEPVTATPVVCAPGTRIAYNPELIGRFKDDHRRLLALCRAIEEAFRRGDFAATAELLERFRVAFQTHLLSENIRLYIYLEHVLAHNPRGYEVVHGFRREMDGIGKVVMAFVSKYARIHLHPPLRESFADKLTGIGLVLAQRIRREEEGLYRLYLPMV